MSFKNIRGCSATSVAVKLICSSNLPCEEVKVANIDLVYNGTKGSITSQCMNVKPILSGIQNPSICSSPYTIASKWWQPQLEYKTTLYLLFFYCFLLFQINYKDQVGMFEGSLVTLDLLMKILG